MADHIELLLRALASRGLRLRGERLALKTLRRQLMYARSKDERLSSLMFRLRSERKGGLIDGQQHSVLDIINTQADVGQIEDAIWT